MAKNPNNWLSYLHYPIFNIIINMLDIDESDTQTIDKLLVFERYYREEIYTHDRIEFALDLERYIQPYYLHFSNITYIIVSKNLLRNVDDFGLHAADKQYFHSCKKMKILKY